MVFNEQAKSTQAEVLVTLKECIGEYKLFEKGSGEETANSVSEHYMQIQVAQKFGRKRL
jgi:hypothetical protein